jgi:NAD(P)-dependent dehydrogenase (short-subunit alcohol dehydrogenase family)
MTPMVSNAIDGLGAEAAKEAMAGVIARHPIGRLGEAREIADACLFLATEESSFMSWC